MKEGSQRGPLVDKHRRQKNIHLPKIKTVFGTVEEVLEQRTEPESLEKAFQSAEDREDEISGMIQDVFTKASKATESISSIEGGESAKQYQSSSSSFFPSLEKMVPSSPSATFEHAKSLFNKKCFVPIQSEETANAATSHNGFYEGIEKVTRAAAMNYAKTVSPAAGAILNPSDLVMRKVEDEIAFAKKTAQEAFDRVKIISETAKTNFGNETSKTTYIVKEHNQSVEDTSCITPTTQGHSESERRQDEDSLETNTFMDEILNVESTPSDAVVEETQQTLPSPSSNAISRGQSSVASSTWKSAHDGSMTEDYILQYEYEEAPPMLDDGGLQKAFCSLDNSIIRDEEAPPLLNDDGLQNVFCSLDNPIIRAMEHTSGMNIIDLTDVDDDVYTVEDSVQTSVVFTTTSEPVVLETIEKETHSKKPDIKSISDTAGKEETHIEIPRTLGQPATVSNEDISEHAGIRTDGEDMKAGAAKENTSIEVPRTLDQPATVSNEDISVDARAPTDDEDVKAGANSNQGDIVQANGSGEKETNTAGEGKPEIMNEEVKHESASEEPVKKEAVDSMQTSKAAEDAPNHEGPSEDNAAEPSNLGAGFGKLLSFFRSEGTHHSTTTSDGKSNELDSDAAAPSVGDVEMKTCETEPEMAQSMPSESPSLPGAKGNNNTVVPVAVAQNSIDGKTSQELQQEPCSADDEHYDTAQESMNGTSVGQKEEGFDSVSVESEQPPRQYSMVHDTHAKTEANFNPLGSLYRSPAPAREPEPGNEKKRFVTLKNEYDDPPAEYVTRSTDAILHDDRVQAPFSPLCLLEPTEEILKLQKSIMGPSVTRRFNACGALKVFAQNNKSNQLALARTDGFFDALIVALNTDLVGDDRENYFFGTRVRALEILLRVCLPKDNRVIMFYHPDLVESIVNCAAEDSGEIRMVACSVLAVLAKSQYLREPMAKVEGLLGVLADSLLGVETQREGEAPAGETKKTEKLKEGHKPTGAQYTSDENSSTGSDTFSECSTLSGSETSYEKSVDSSKHEDKVKKEGATEEKKKEMAKQVTQNACAALLHLSKQSGAVHAMCLDTNVIDALLILSQQYEHPMHTKCLEVLFNLTRLPSNNEILAEHRSAIPVVLKVATAEDEEDRVLAMRVLQNISAGKAGKKVLVSTFALELLSMSALRGTEAEEQKASVAALFNLSTDPGCLMGLINTRDVLASLVLVVGDMNNSSDVRMMACDMLSTIGLWLQKLTRASTIPAGVSNGAIPTNVTAGWNRWE